MTKSAARRILFVCAGNTCRSPMAQFLFARMAREAGLPWTTASAGVAARAGAPLSSGAVSALASRGITGVSHAAAPADAAALDAADAVYALAREHADALKARFPSAAAKIKVLRAAAGLTPEDVEDPVGQDETVYAQTAAAIEEALGIVLEKERHAPNHR